MSTEHAWQEHVIVEHGWSEGFAQHFEEAWKQLHKGDHDGSVRNMMRPEGRPHSHPTGQLSPIELPPLTMDAIIESFHGFTDTMLRDLILAATRILNERSHDEIPTKYPEAGRVDAGGGDIRAR